MNLAFVSMFMLENGNCLQYQVVKINLPNDLRVLIKIPAHGALFEVNTLYLLNVIRISKICNKISSW